jgi:hypothetical protein
MLCRWEWHYNRSVAGILGIFLGLWNMFGTSGSLVGSGAMLQAGKLWLHHGPGFCSASNRNEYKEYSWGGGGEVWLVHKATVHHVWADSRKCGILNVLQPYRPPWPLTGKALFFSVFHFFYSETCHQILRPKALKGAVLYH